MAASDGGGLPDPLALTRQFADIAAQSQRLVSEFLEQQTSAGGLDDMNAIGKAFVEMNQRWLANPGQWLEAQMSLWQGHMELWQQSASAFWGQAASDKRVAELPDWQQRFVFDYIKQSYLLTARWLQSTVGQVESLDEKTRRKLDFYTRQFVHALSPQHFPLTNPEVLRVTLDSGGANLLHGLRNLLHDLERGRGWLQQPAAGAFQLGSDIAATPGEVVYRNELIELLQYRPLGEQVYQHPLLVVPPWLNKHYIFDLRPENSLIKWWLEQGFTVFVISWVDPDAELAEKDFEDYLEHGILAAMDAVAQASGEARLNLVAYCLGGVLAAAAMAWLAGQGDRRVQSCTYLATLLDFEQPGELEVFIDEEELSALEQGEDCPGGELATIFNMLRANDLIWSFFVSSYLLGREPFPFDLLYWNSDSTRMPVRMHGFYLRNMYQNNLLKEPGGLSLLGKPIDLQRVSAPTYLLALVEDHIVPWQSVYGGTALFRADVRFVLGGSGHIAGIVNPPTSGTYGYWHNDSPPGDNPADAAGWLRGARRAEGSWWTDWQAWVQPFCGAATAAARVPGDGALQVLEPAPGSYARSRRR